MTFESIDRALDYLSGQNPGKIAIIAPVRRDGGVVAYQIEFHRSDKVMTRVIPHARIIQLKISPSGWDLQIVGTVPRARGKDDQGNRNGRSHDGHDHD